MSDRNESISLHNTEGSSDKIYNAFLEEVEGGLFMVHGANGPRGGTMKVRIKTKTPVPYDKAKKEYDKLVKSKIASMYKPVGSDAAAMHYESDQVDSGARPQLLNFIEEDEVLRLIEDDRYWAQEKHDGERRMIKKADDIIAINKKGLTTGMSKSIADYVSTVDGKFLVDGEDMGDMMFAFDLLELNGKDLRPLPYHERMDCLEDLNFSGPIERVKSARTSAGKRFLYEQLIKDNAEGIVFKRWDAPFTENRPANGGDQLKYKLYATATVYVTAVNEKRSVAMSLLDNIDSRKWVPVGNVTIPPNKEIPLEGFIIEVEYLYAYRGGSLFQPQYIGPRDDQGFEDCLLSQLKYKRGK